MMVESLKILQNVFGYNSFRPPQDEIIQALIDGQDAVVLMPTGGGKSLCYQIPAMIRNGTGIVISPLIALMQDQVSSLRQCGVKAAFLNSSLNTFEAREVEQQLLCGQLDVLYIAPERLVMPQFLGLLNKITVALFAIDEAHCVSQWGHDFRPEYIQLGLITEQFPDVPRIALTATADETTRKDIIERLQLNAAKYFVCGFDRPNIRYQITQGQKNARQSLLNFIQTFHQNDAGIVYCLSRKKVDQTAAWMVKQGLNALPYHAGLDTETRQQHQHRFIQEEGLIIVATIAFGMGIDKPNVRFVAHLSLPKSIEAYYQETGRAGRDGLPANAWMSYGLQDVILLRQMMQNSNAENQFKRLERQKLEAILGFCEITSCRRQSLLRYFGDHLQKPCNNCDTCLTPVKTWDASTKAQMALSCVYRTGQRFGVNYLIDVLLGSKSDRIRQFNHQKLNLFGIGVDLSNQQWRNLFRQLIARDYLSVDVEGHGSLKLSKKCSALLKGEESLWLRDDPEKSKSIKSASTKKRSIIVDDAENEFWQALRACRKQLAEDNNIPPYQVFHDATLLQMLESKPQSRQQFAEISGVGAHKLEIYAEPFLQIIRDYGEN